MAELMSQLLLAIALFLLLTGAACFAILVKGSLMLRRLAREHQGDYSSTLLKSGLTPAVSVIFAPPDASQGARAMARRLLGLHFGNHELIVAIHSLPEAELAAWREEFHLAPSKRPIAAGLDGGRIRTVYESRDPVRMTVLEIESGGAPGALNAAVDAAQSPVIALFDGDADFDPLTLLRMIRPMMEDPKHVVAVCGVEADPPPRGTAGRLAALAFLRTWMSRCAAFSEWNMLMPVPGCGMLIARGAIVKAGGFRAEPLELILRLHSAARAAGQPYRVVLVPAAGCRRRTPQSIAQLRKLTTREQRETARAVFTSGALAWWAAPGLFAVRCLRPVLETAAYALTVIGLAMKWVEWPLAGLVLLSTVGMGVLISMAAIALRELSQYEGTDPRALAALFFTAIPENLGFRQLRNLWLIASFAKKADA